MTAIVCALLGGFLFFFSVELHTVWLLAWIAPTPLLWLAYGRARTWQVFSASLAAYTIGQLSVFEAYGAMASALAIVITATGIVFAGAILFARLAQRNLPAMAAVFAFPMLWTTVEYLNANFSAFGSFGAFAYSQVPAPILIQSASLFGLWSITFLICGVASATALLLREKRRAVAPFVGIAMLFAVNLIFGLARLAAPPSGAEVRVAAAANGETQLPVTEAAAQSISQQYANVAMGLAAEKASAIVFPEEITLLKPEWTGATDDFARAAQASGSQIIVGYREVADAQRSIALTFAQGETARYVKRHLIPGLEQLEPGHGPGLLGQDRAVAICKDMDFGDTIRNDARHGIRIMYVPAWDFNEDGETHANIAIMRGVENGFAVVRAARNGLLTITDAEGRIQARAAASSPDIISIIANVPLGPGPTLYTRIGDLFAWLCAGGVLALAAWIICRSLFRRRGSCNSKSQ